MAGLQRWKLDFDTKYKPRWLYTVLLLPSSSHSSLFIKSKMKICPLFISICLFFFIYLSANLIYLSTFPSVYSIFFLSFQVRTYSI